MAEKPMSESATALLVVAEARGGVLHLVSVEIDRPRAEIRANAAASSAEYARA